MARPLIPSLMACVAAFALAGCAPSSLATATPDAPPPDRRAPAFSDPLPPMNVFGSARAEPVRRPNAQIARDFLDLSFQMESGRRIDRLSRFEGPITVTVRGAAPETLGPDLDRLLARLRDEAQINIRRVEGAASITIETLPRARMQSVVPQAACFVVPRVSSWGEFRRERNSGALDWTTLETRERAAVFIPNDVAPQEVRDCLHEEIAQAIGPLNDLYRLPDSIFNDDNFHAVLTGFDMLILRTYYDPALSSGLTREEVRARLPAILARLNPAGERGGAGSLSATPPAWTEAIETALGRRTPQSQRMAAVRRAVSIAQSRGWTDGRLAFSYFALGRISLADRNGQPLTAFRNAGRIYERIAPGGIQSAHVDMQIAAFALSAGNWEAALDLTGDALPAATRAQNASLMSTLLMIRAEALERMGRASEARAVRLDSLAWGRYGFGETRDVRDRLTEIAALPPES